MRKTSDKRTRLLKAARKLIHQKGFSQTTLAEIAIEANVPLGNIYYYFNTKDLIAETVVKELSEEYKALFEQLNKKPIESRLLDFLKLAKENVELKTQYGCPVGTLCQEWGKEKGILGDQIAHILQAILTWCEEQFKALGHEKRASDLAIYMVASLQGIYLLNHAFKNPTLINRQLDTLQAWVENIMLEPIFTVKEATAH